MSRLFGAILSSAIVAWACAPVAAQTLLPQIKGLSRYGGQRGEAVEITVRGRNIGLGTGVALEGAGIVVESVKPDPPDKPSAPGADGAVRVRLKISRDAEPGVRALRVLTPLGPSDVARFVVGAWPEAEEKEPNGDRIKAQALTLPCTVNGRMDSDEDIDFYRFHAEGGQIMVFDVTAAEIGSPLAPRRPYPSRRPATISPAFAICDTKGVASMPTD